jgi:hypothetical protein
MLIDVTPVLLRSNSAAVRVTGSIKEYRNVASSGCQNKIFRTINVRWIGQWRLLALVPVPRINNLCTINTPNSSDGTSILRAMRMVRRAVGQHARIEARSTG